MNSLYKIFLVVASGVVLGGCSDFLMEKSQDEVIVRTTKDYGELLLGSGYPGAEYRIVSDFDDDTDFPVGALAESYPQAADESYFARYTWQPDLYETGAGTSVGSTSYYMLYMKIMGCNAVLDGIDEAIGAQNERDRVKAEALAIRALHYFNLVNIYGEPYSFNPKSLGVPLKLTADLEEAGRVRSTVEEVYGQIVSDLNEAAGLLDDYPVTQGDYRINLPAIRVLLSRVYLFMEDWEKAASEASKAMSYGLGLLDLTQFGDDSELIMNTYNSHETFWNYGAFMWSSGGGISPIPSEEFMDFFSNEADKRFGSYGLYVRPIVYNNYVIGYSIYKSSSALGQALRVSEAYLNRAEAYAQMEGKREDAIRDLNALRKNRLVGYDDRRVDFPNLLDSIRFERRREFCFEGYRWFDLRRYGMPEITHHFKETASSPVMRYTLKKEDPMYTLPIPRSVMEINLVLEQNPSAYIPVREGEML